jgi:hypothetical protein
MKYRQKGYRDSEFKRDDRKKEPPKPRTPEERQLRHMMERSANLVLRCFQCSADAGSIDGLGSLSKCGSCGAALHVCRNCANFDTGARWECRAPITDPVLDKTAANDCAFFKANTVLDATGRRSGGSTPTDARAAFDNLFKKK